MAVYTCAAHKLHLIIGDITKLNSAGDKTLARAMLKKSKSRKLKACCIQLQKEMGNYSVIITTTAHI